ncbi:MAG TPA: hypothetical protein VH054_21960 [Polyangiaceae bacterium]|jgi:hypothetical protein|nr:hypothetical protein [Polyangiaceae bacterium]
MSPSFKNKSNISRNTAENSLVRALQFLRAVGTDANIMQALGQCGFDEQIQKEGWSLVLAAYAAPNGPAATSIADAPLTVATSKVEAWQNTMFVRAHAALGRLYPEQDEFVFANLEMGTDLASVPAVVAFLDRLDALESSPERKTTRKVDHAALETLDKRGLTKEQRKEMRATVKWIESTPAEAPQQVVASPRDGALLAVYEWVQDWSDCARTVITRRDQRIRLGIGKRRSRKSDVATPTPPPVPAPITVTPVPSGSDTSSTDPSLMLMARAPLALPPKPNGATPGSVSIVKVGDHR